MHTMISNYGKGKRRVGEPCVGPSSLWQESPATGARSQALSVNNVVCEDEGTSWEGGLIDGDGATRGNATAAAIR